MGNLVSLTVLKLKGVQACLMEMETESARLVPQISQIRIDIPSYRMPNLIRVIRTNGDTIFRGESGVRLEIGIENLHANVAAVTVGIDIQAIALEYKLPSINLAILVGRLELRPSVFPQDKRADRAAPSPDSRP